MLKVGIEGLFRVVLGEATLSQGSGRRSGGGVCVARADSVAAGEDHIENIWSSDGVRENLHNLSPSYLTKETIFPLVIVDLKARLKISRILA